MFIGRGQRVLVSPSFLSARAAARLIAIALALATGLMDSSFAYANEAGEAPAASDSVLAPTPSAWQRQPKDDLKIKFGIEVPRYNFEILAPENVSGSRAKFEPNTPSKTAIGFSYRNLGLNLATSNSADADSVAKYGSSSSTDLQLRLFGKRTYEFYFQEYNGYFISNSEDLDPAYKAVSSKIKRPDIKSKNFGVNFFWSLHESDFSQAVAWEQLGWQERSSWGVSWLVHLSQNSIEADAVLIPSLAKASFGNLGSLKDFHSNTLATGFGLGGT